MAGKAQITSAASAYKLRPLGKGWTRNLKNWLNQFLSESKAAEVVAGFGTSISQTERGRSVNAASGGGGGLVGDDGLPIGADNLETVTGAVNGVPSTLNVQTDGNGWAEI